MVEDSIDMTNAIVRPAARLIVIAPDDRVLLFKWTHELLRSPSGSVWITPGGGLEGDETYEQAAMRELREETGITVPLGACVWTRRHVFPWRVAPIDQRERFFVVRVADTALSRDGWMPWEHEHQTEERWWSVDEIAASDEWFAPPALASLLPAVLRGEYGNEPIDVGE
jgi:8-oxo-dGTP pyrophosphatase MutT (NUDIX family)